MNDGGLLLGLDIGGTKLGLCAGDTAGRILAAERLPMDHTRTPESLLNECVSRLAQLTAQAAQARAVSEVAMALGVACPGPLDYVAGRFLNPPNNPRWHGFEIRKWLEKNVPYPSAIMNDANATVLAEWRWGAAHGTRSAVFLTMSTGMGAGFILDGRLYEGPLGLAGEIGRIRLTHDDAGPVGFGRRGSAEGYCSGPGMVQLALSEALVCRQTGQQSTLTAHLPSADRPDPPPITPSALCEAARSGDPAALRVTDRVAAELGKLMAILTDILNPEVFVLGTIGTAYPDLFIPGARKALLAEALPQATASVRIVPSGLADKGSQSALAVALHSLKR